MRVLLNTTPLAFSTKTGVGYYVSNLYRELQKSEIDVVPTLDNKSKTLVSSLSKISSRLRAHFGKRYPAFVRTIGDALISHLSMREASTLNYDLYHETSLDPMPEIKTMSICTLHDLAFVRCPELLPEEFVKNTRINIMKNASIAKRIIVTTQFIKDEVISILRLPEEKIDIIPLAPSAHCHRIDKPISKPQIVKRFTEKDYILYVGTVDPRKNLKILIKAFNEIRRKYNISLIIAGSFGWLYNDIISYPRELSIEDDVIFTKYIDEKTLLYLYNYASVFVYPSLYEGFGLPPLESMACGIPVILSDIPPLKEVAGDAALYFNPEDHEELAHMITKFLSTESLISDMKQKGFKKVSEYSWHKVATLTIQTYKKTLEE